MPASTTHFTVTITSGPAMQLAAALHIAAVLMVSATLVFLLGGEL